MNREIKFRAWDGIKMHYDFVVARPQFADVLGILTDEEFAKTQYRLSMWKVMQYTGLKDKNGRGIWEGDIIRVPNNIKHIIHDPWSLVQVYFSDEGIWYCDGDYLFECNEESDVIGNIYENPELLTSGALANWD